MKKITILPLIGLALALASCGGEKKDGIKNEARIGYQVFVDTFANGNKANDLNNISGDINGVIDNLDYLKDNLNIEVLWLTPVHRSGSYHGYDVDDYRSIREAFGGMESYTKLLTEAHKRGIKVMMDLVINHTSKNNEWFLKSMAKEKEYRDYYRWTPTRVTNDRYKLNGEYYYALFWDGMPDLNYDNPKVYDEMLEVCKFWMDKGVDGFRVDGAKHVYNYDTSKGMELYEGSDNLATLNYNKNLEFFNKFSKDIKKLNKNAFLTLEVLDNSSSAYSGFYEQGIDSCFDFQTKNSIISNVGAGSGEMISYSYSTLIDDLDDKNPDMLNSLILSNHDIDRVMSKLSNNTEAAKASAAIQMLLPGLSWIYNGDELGMSGVKVTDNNGDLAYRQPYKWGNEYDTSIIRLGGTSNEYDEHNRGIKPAAMQLKDPDSMLSFYKAITTLKANDKVIKYGSFEPISLGRAVCAFTRSLDGTTYLCLVNTNNKPSKVSYDFTDGNIIYASKEITLASDSTTIPSYGTAVIKVKK